jgi:hypothetical protein
MTLDESLRRKLAAVADELIPATDGMPSPSSVDIGGTQLDLVLAARPDLEVDLRRALVVAEGVEDPIAWLVTLAANDPDAHGALVLAVCAGYYLHREVQRRLGYPGQVPEEVSVAALPDYVHEELLERVYERGPIYRPTPTG